MFEILTQLLITESKQNIISCIYFDFFFWNTAPIAKSEDFDDIEKGDEEVVENGVVALVDNTPKEMTVSIQQPIFVEFYAIKSIWHTVKVKV